MRNSEKEQSNAGAYAEAAKTLHKVQNIFCGNAWVNVLLASCIGIDVRKRLFVVLFAFLVDFINSCIYAQSVFWAR